MADSSVMDKKGLKGSPSRDSFKHWHKQGPKDMYASDLDLVFVDKYPPGIVAAMDYKTPSDSVSFSEVLLYNDLLSLGIPVYIVTSVEPFESFTVELYKGGDYKPDPPIYELEAIHKDIDRTTYWQWERTIRLSYRAQKGIAKSIPKIITDEQIKEAILRKGFVQAWAFVGELIAEVMALVTKQKAA